MSSNTQALSAIAVISAIAVAIAAIVYKEATREPCKVVFPAHSIITHKTLGKAIAEENYGIRSRDEENLCYVNTTFKGVQQNLFSPKDFEEYKE